jgi:hypothetical protein
VGKPLASPIRAELGINNNELATEILSLGGSLRSDALPVRSEAKRGGTPSLSAKEGESRKELTLSLLFFALGTLALFGDGSFWDMSDFHHTEIYLIRRRYHI